jgi:hypothetical protein
VGRAIADETGDLRLGSVACRNLAILALWFGDYAEASALLAEAVASSEEVLGMGAAGSMLIAVDADDERWVDE